MEKQMAAIFSLLSFNYLMFKYWGTWRVILLALIGNYFFICILIKLYLNCNMKLNSIQIYNFINFFKKDIQGCSII